MVGRNIRWKKSLERSGGEAESELKAWESWAEGEAELIV